MTRDEKIEILKSYRRLTLKLNRLADQITELRNAALPSSFVYDGMPKGHGRDAMELIDRAVELQEEFYKVHRARQRIERAIEALGGRQGTVLRLMYIERLKTDEIASQLNISKAYVYGLRDAALMRLEL